MDQRRAHKILARSKNFCGRGNWKEISKIIETKTGIHTQSHGQKYFLRQKQKNKNKRSIHDFSLSDFETEAKVGEDSKNFSWNLFQRDLQAKKRENDEPPDAIVTTSNKRFCFGIDNKCTSNFECQIGSNLGDEFEDKTYTFPIEVESNAELNPLYIELKLQSLLPSFLSGTGSFLLPLPKNGTN